MKKNNRKNGKLNLESPGKTDNQRKVLPNQLNPQKSKTKIVDIPGLEYEESSPVFKEATDPTFLTNDDEIQQMENDLLMLVKEFSSGKHNAFDQTLFEKMDRIRDQQEGLAKLHFELNVKRESEDPAVSNDMEASRSTAQESMSKLMVSLNDLSNSLHRLYEVKEEDPLPGTSEGGSVGVETKIQRQPPSSLNRGKVSKRSLNHQQQSTHSDADIQGETLTP